MKKFVLSFNEFNEQMINPDCGNAAKDRSKTEIDQNIKSSSGLGAAVVDKEQDEKPENKKSKSGFSFKNASPTK